MRAFALGTGRCGTHTLWRACGHMENYTAGHETRTGAISDRLAYPDDHVEVDNRLSWFLGSLDRVYGDEAVYVHLTRDPEAVARSYARRFGVRDGIMPAFGGGILRLDRPRDRRRHLDLARLYVQTVHDNVRLFLRGKTRVVPMAIEEPHEALDRLWGLLGAVGDLRAAQEAIGRVHNASRR